MSPPASVLVWDGQDVVTIGELFDTAGKAADEGRAAEFLKAYRAVNQHADANIGYVIGYAEPHERRQQLWAAFGLQHPVLGGMP